MVDFTTLTAVAGATGALVAALIMAISNITTSIIARKSEERKHYRELIISLSVENYKEERDLAKVLIEKQPNRKYIFYPLDDFIINMTLLADRIIDKNLTKDEIISTVKEMDEIRRELQEFRENSSQNS